VKKGSKLQVYKSEEEWLVAGLSKPLSGHHITLYLFTAKSSQVVPFPLLDVTKVGATEATEEELVPAQRWWNKLLEEEAEKKQKKVEAKEQKVMIKKEAQEAQQQLAQHTATKELTRELAGLKKEMEELKWEIRAMRETLLVEIASARKEAQSTFLDVVRAMTGSGSNK